MSSAEGQVEGGAEVSARSVVAHYFRIWNDGDTSLLNDLLSESWMDHARPELRSVDDVANAIAEARQTQPDMRIYVDAMLGDDQLITVNGRISTGQGTKSRVWIIRVEEGRMQEMWTYSAG